MFPALTLALLAAVAPQTITEPKTGVAVTLPPMCVVIPEVAFEQKPCGPLTAEHVRNMRAQLTKGATERARVIGMGVTDGIRVIVTDVTVKKRTGKLPAGFIEKLVKEEAAGAGSVKPPVHQVETINGVSVVRIEMTLKLETDVPSTLWMVLTPTSNFSVAVVDGPKEKGLTLGRAIMKTLVVPEAQRLDLTTR